MPDDNNNKDALGLGVSPEDGPFMKGVHQTTLVLWAAIGLIFLGAALLGVFVISWYYHNRGLTWGTLAGGLTLSAFGAGLGLRNRILQDVT